MPSEAARFEGLVRTYRTADGRGAGVPGRDGRDPRRRGLASSSARREREVVAVAADRGLDRPTAGSIEVVGCRDRKGGSRRRRSIRRDAVGYVFQRPSDNLLGHLTVAQHLRLASRSGSPDADVMATADALDIADRLDHRPEELSGGEQQRAAVAQALASGARIVVADEPTAELDSESADAVLGRIAELATQGITFILATHDRSVMEISDHRLTLEHGVVAGAGPSARLGAGRERGHSPPMAGGRRLVAGWRRTGRARLDAVTKSYGVGGSVVHALDGGLSRGRTRIDGRARGRSGSGKTTLLNVVAGWDTPDGGAVARPGGADPPGPTSPWCPSTSG